MRLDLFLTEKGIYDSRTRARRAIEEGCVRVNGVTVKKPALDVTTDDNIAASEDPVPYVSRGALKLKHALEHFNIDIKGLVAVDIGASTGGFTEIMLLGGAEKVYAVDVGRSQLAGKLLTDRRVVNMEQTDIRSLAADGSEYEDFFQFAACDASFISLRMILPSAAKILKQGALGVFLIKPQFEVGKRFVGKGGIVKDKKAIDEAVEGVVLFAAACGFTLAKKIIPSPITGGDGNHEFLTVLKKI